MQRYEYKVIPAPQKGVKAKGVKTAEGRFAVSVEQVLNQMGQDGWEYQRAELLPSEERAGLTGSTTNWRNVLVFRRVVEEEVDAPEIGTALDMDSTPLAQPVQGPDEVQAPKPIAAEADEPPLSLKRSDETPEAGEISKT
ncbi:MULTISPECIES: DUF4177 domain-containing protein [unclassified Ruegeria]|uniref:DUF4177 domain-containing protein n=1 Tax=unclassified Ruegeria TaxID=2625375 RepID=UPI001491AB69|nr:MULTISPECIES: DUF4177 domain-containing protein [unclassified Ruegeria]NOD48360.1 DUF4177 domain-containing protein [Ruegeria sp. HKCCD5849]NOD52380.1 DUF4177 domain-containing protein [Ruegeria sp. HKCCD5851]NOD68483.1 DUF4177 domain-containing protein [Ruegeria sp. HKCCD7303]